MSGKRTIKVDAFIPEAPKEDNEYALVEVDMRNFETDELLDELRHRTLSSSEADDMIEILKVDGYDVVWDDKEEYVPFKSENLMEQLKMDVLAAAFERYTLEELETLLNKKSP